MAGRSFAETLVGNPAEFPAAAVAELRRLGEILSDSEEASRVTVQRAQAAVEDVIYLLAVAGGYLADDDAAREALRQESCGVVEDATGAGDASPILALDAEGSYLVGCLGGGGVPEDTGDLGVGEAAALLGLPVAVPLQELVRLYASQVVAGYMQRRLEGRFRLETLLSSPAGGLDGYRQDSLARLGTQLRARLRGEDPSQAEDATRLGSLEAAVAAARHVGELFGVDPEGVPGLTGLSGDLALTSMSASGTMMSMGGGLLEGEGGGDGVEEEEVGRFTTVGNMQDMMGEALRYGAALWDAECVAALNCPLREPLEIDDRDDGVGGDERGAGGGGLD